MNPKAGRRGKIRVLDSQDDLYELFGAGGCSSGLNEEASTVDAGAFDRMLDDALSGADRAELIRRKYPDADFSDTYKRRTSAAGSVQAELDLHGFHVQEALVRLESFIETAALQGFDALRIIVGRGMHSPTGAVLPDAVEKKLVELKRAGRVATFAWEKKSKRSSGALIVYPPR